MPAVYSVTALLGIKSSAWSVEVIVASYANYVNAVSMYTKALASTVFAALELEVFVRRLQTFAMEGEV